MVELSFPFWILIDPASESAPAAFSTAKRLSDFLDGSLVRWKMLHIGDCESLLLAIADAHQQGAALVWLDPVSGTEPGDSIHLIDLAELHEQLKRAA